MVLAQKLCRSAVLAGAVLILGSLPVARLRAQTDKRVFGVLPNYKTVEGTGPAEPLTVKQKFAIAAKDSFDWPVLLVSGAFAGLSHLQNQNPSFGQGMAGYGKRWAAAYGDQAVGNFLAEAAMPALFHEDPRYFRRGEGSVPGRLGYAVSRVLVTRTDAGRRRFNCSEFAGNGLTAAAANLYYRDDRDARDNVQRLAVLVATDAFGNVLKEFWPDIKRRMFARHAARDAGGSVSPALPAGL